MARACKPRCMTRNSPYARRSAWCTTRSAAYATRSLWCPAEEPSVRDAARLLVAEKGFTREEPERHHPRVGFVPKKGPPSVRWLFALDPT